VSLPSIGETAPDFTGMTDTGDIFRLSDQRGRWVCVFFYPKDDTPG
jgi:peroxiredoxin Q/BCP